MATNVIVLNSEPGIQRDGTAYDSKSYIDGQWVRFYRDRPLKIGGYKLIDQGNGTIIRTVYNYDNPGRPNTVDTYLGRADSVVYENFTLNGDGIGEVDRTPTNYATYANDNNLWEFDTFTDASDPSNPLIVASVAPNANDVSNTTQGPIYYGSTTGPTGNARLVQVLDESSNPILVSGGIVFSAPILIACDNNGLIRWSNPGSINAWPSANAQTIANTKIIQMVIARGSAAPQLLAWTANAVISLTYTIDGANVAFSAVTIDNKITLMSPNSIIGHASEFFWIGLTQFFFFNGVVRTLDNTMNSQFFFQNINLSQRSKVWAEIISPGEGITEIWWHFPKKSTDDPDPQECNHALIYHVEMKRWSDTAINRSAGASAGVFPLPMMADNVPLEIVTRSGAIQVYPLWMHEFGYDMVVSASNVSAIDSYFETHIYDFFESNPNNNRAMRTRRIEPDFLMNGNMQVTVNNRFFPSDTIANGKLTRNGPYTFDLNTQKIDAVNSQGRLVSFRFESNELGGAYQMGKTLLNYNVGDDRPSGSGNSGTGG